MRFYKIKTGYIFLLLMFFGCTENKEFIEFFFEKLEERPVVSGEMANEIKSLPQDSLYRYWYIFRIECERLITELECEDQLHQYIDTNAVSFSSERGRILYYAFHKYLNQKSIDMDEIQFNVVEQYIKPLLPRRGSNSEIHKKELSEIIMHNDMKWQVGDTLTFIFPLFDNSKKQVQVLFYPNTLHIPKENDTLKMDALLLAKYYSNSYPGMKTTKLTDPINLYFKLKILNLSRPSIIFYQKEFTTRDNLHLPLEFYGRQID